SRVAWGGGFGGGGAPLWAAVPPGSIALGAACGQRAARGLVEQRIPAPTREGARADWQELAAATLAS
uniref:hypothetical protein n=1 Tax=Nocardia farcinica TaxID=37329 RepID=UPI002458F73A